MKAHYEFHLGRHIIVITAQSECEKDSLVEFARENSEISGRLCEDPGYKDPILVLTKTM